MTAREWLLLIMTSAAWMLASIVWALRLEGRVSLLERLVEDEIATTRQSTSTILQRLGRIDDRLHEIQITCAAFNHRRPTPPPESA